MTKNTQPGSEPWAVWAESMQKMMGNPAALNPFAGMAQLGGMMGMPGMAGAGAANPLDAAALMKAIDPEEINRRINDMRAVEAWLKFSLSTLEMSIKTMEMQRDAYASFSKMRETADAGVKTAMDSVKRASRSASRNAAAGSARKRASKSAK
jgi:hypothetical protein